MKRLLLIPAALLVLIFVALAITPFVLSTDFVKQRVEAHLAQMTGQSFTLRGATSLSLRPYLGIAFDDVAVSASSPLDPWITMGGLKARIGFLSLLAGKVDVERLQFVRPRFRLHQREDGSLVSPAGQSLMPQPDRDSGIAPGRIEIIDGRIVIHGVDGKVRETILGIAGSMVWPSLSSPISAQLEGRWRGAAIKLDTNVEEPGSLLASDSSDIVVELAIDKATLTMTGSLSRGDGLFSGEASLNVPQPDALSQTLRLPIPLAARLPASRLSGQLQGGLGRLAIESAEIVVGDSTGRGRIQLQFDEKRVPRIGGTLAFDTITLPPLSDDAISISVEGDSKGMGLLDGLALDLRLSAEQARFGDLPLRDVAATLTLADGVGLMDIAEASAFGGTLAGMIELDLAGKQPDFKLELVANQADLAELSPLARLDKVSLEGRVSGTLSALLSGKTRVQRLASINGTGAFRLDSGRLNGLSVTPLLNRTAEDPSVDSAAFFAGQTSFEEADVEFVMRNGVIFLTGASLRSEDTTLWLGGRFDVDKGSLAIRGSVQEGRNGAGEDSKRAAFFIGGTAEQPLLVELEPERPRRGTVENAPSQDGN